MKVKTIFVVTLTAFVGATTYACSSSAPADKMPLVLPSTYPAPTVAKKAATIELGAGVYEVPKEVKPGTYVTRAGDGDYCYWARLSDFQGDGADSINANGNLRPGARGRFTVTKTDKGVEFRGTCVWTPAR